MPEMRQQADKEEKPGRLLVQTTWVYKEDKLTKQRNKKMSLTFKADIVHTEKYTDKQTGEEKKKYTKIGAVFVREDGSECAKILDSWVNFYPKKVDERGYQEAKQAVQNAGPVDELEDEIPFMRVDERCL